MASKITFDLHCHCAPYSTCARQSVDELLSRANLAGIKTIAITNHDTMKDEALFKTKAQNLGMSLIPGIEIGASNKGEISSIPLYVKIHILGYCTDKRPELIEDCFKGLNGINQKIKHERNEHIRHRFSVSFPDGTLKRDIRTALVKSGAFASDKEAKNFLGSKEILERFQVIGPSIKEAINLIHQSGGTAVLAHCFQGENHFEFTDDQVAEIVSYAVMCGLDGIEAFHPHLFKIGKVDYALKEAKENKLFVTLGSDRHFAEDKVEGQYFSFDHLITEGEIQMVDLNQLRRNNI